MKNLIYKIIEKIKEFISKIFCIKTTIIVSTYEPYELVFNEKFIDNAIDTNFWMITPKGPSSWNKYMGGEPEILEEDANKFIRFNCVQNDDTYLTSGIKTKQQYGDGKFECEARFKSGHGTWPAIWLCHSYSNNDNYARYYEVDISEYYETRDTTDVTYHCPESMRDSKKWNYINVKTPIKKNDWNKFVCTWDNDAITVYVNDEKTMEILNDNDSLHFPIDAENRTFLIILSMQYNFKNSTLNNEELPLYMDVKNIKYYRKNEIN